MLPSRRLMVMALATIVMATVAVVRRAAGDENHKCGEDEKDGRGNCPPVTKPPPKKPASPSKPSLTKLDVRCADTSIAGAQVSLDGDLKGTAPIVLETTPAKHLIEVTKDGAAFKQWVTVKQGELKAVPVTLSSTSGAPTPTPQHGIGAKPGGCPAEMVHETAASFFMGSADDVGEADEHPQHKVTLSGYCLDRTEVTADAYGKCVSAGECPAATTDPLCNGGVAGKGSHPINCVSWDESKLYCEWVGKRLPTEAEWEHAARGSDGRVYPWGNEIPDDKRLRWGATDGTSPVGSYSDGASQAGALDLAGNVWEWVADWYGPYSKTAESNPTGATTGTLRVRRGGGWASKGAGFVRAAFRGRDDARRSERLGFRCAHGD